MSDYKVSKEAFVSGMTGSSIGHVNLISLIALASIALYSAVRTRMPPTKPLPLYTSWLLLALPLLLSMTLCARRPIWLLIGMLLPTGALVLYVPVREAGTPLPSSQPSSPVNTDSAMPNPAAVSIISPLPALTVYRSHMMLMTMLGILAVDFPVLPRSLAKCESFGISIMDLGVGSFVFSQGVVSAIPLLKDPTYLSSPVAPKFMAVVRKTLPIIFLGVVRVVLVKGTEYPEHETEYGTHWNFFITLALLPALQILFHPIFRRVDVSISFIAGLVAVAHQGSLSLLGLQHYVATAPRLNIFSANKEGIVSLVGYLAIHLLGLSTGTVILPPSPSYFRHHYQGQAKKTKQMSMTRQDDKTAIELGAYAALWWGLLFVAGVFGIGKGVSRQLVNLQYILWIAAFNTSFILGYLLVDMFFFPRTMPKKRTVPSNRVHGEDLRVPSVEMTPTVAVSRVGSPPPLLDAINKNALALFLLANVATGLINLSIPTMYVSDAWAMVVLCVYSFGLCAIAWAFRGRRLWLL